MEGGKKSENIFDLTAIVGIQKEEEIKKKSALITDDEQKALIKDYIEVNKDEWSVIPNNTHIRYLRKDGAFRRGGFIKNSWIGVNGASKDKKCLQLSASMNYKASKWTICLDDIEKIWKKKSPEQKNIISSDIQNMVRTNNETTEYLTRSVEQLKIDVTQLSNEQKRIINLIKKLHGIKRTPTQAP